MTDPVKPSKEIRSLRIERAGYNPETRELSLSFASELPVRRYYGIEILSCDPKDVDLSRLNDGAPLLLDHDAEHESHIGTIRGATVDADKICRATCLLSQRDDVRGVIQDITDGILSKASVGYETTDILSTETDPNTGERTIKWKWKPIEVSLVTVPADSTVGVGRSAGVAEETRKNMSEKNDTTASAAPATVEVVKDNSAEVRKTTAEIMRLGRKHECLENAEKAIESGKTVDEFRAEVLEIVGKRSPAPVRNVSAAIGMSEKEVRQYSFLRAIRSQVPGEKVDSTLEREASDAVAKMLGKSARGLFVPFDVQVAQKRDLQITGGGTGSAVVATNLLSGSFIEALRNAMVLDRVGATMLTGLVGDIAIPKQTAAATAYWVTEGNAPTESQATLGQVTGTPHSVAANTDITRKLMMQSSVDVESLVRNDIAQVLARGIDYACFNDAGAGAPAYLLGVSGVNNPSISSAGSATYAEILAFASQIAADNVSTDGGKWVTTNEVFYNLCGLPRHATASAAGFIADVDNSTIIGRPAFQSESLPANTAVFGVWQHLIVAMWGNGLDLVVDPYTQSKAGIVQVTGFMDVDFLPRHPQAFAYNSAVTA